MGNDFWEKENARWMEELTPFDFDLARMVENLTGKPCILKDGGENFFFEADYSLHHDSEWIMALWDAIEGRTGQRLVEMYDDPERHALFVRVKFSKEKFFFVAQKEKE